MNYKTVMVSLALDRPNDACLAVAGDLAERFGARVIGIAASDLKPPCTLPTAATRRKSSMRRPPPFEGDCPNSRRNFVPSIGKHAESR